MGKLIDETGHIYGRLTVLYRDKKNDTDNKPKWICKCNCGNITSVSGKALRQGRTKSCGCLNNERIGNLNKLDLTGKTFGFLTAIEPIKIDGILKWKCECALCGKYTYVATNHLTNCHTQSCGCLTMSTGEYKIAQLLDKAAIPYIREKHFKDCKQYRFDFWVNNQYIIEYDGVHHFEANGGWNTEERVTQVKQRDKEKNNYCFQHNIPIIRIPYTYFNQITINDLLLETSSFLLKHAEEANNE